MLTTGKQWLEAFITDRQTTRGLTPKGERWVRQTVGKFPMWISVPLVELRREHLVAYLAQWQDQPWQKHSMYRGLKTFFRWASRTYDVPNPMNDRWGNPIIESPKVPSKVLYTITPDKVHRLIEAAKGARDKAIISLLADSGARQNEVTGILTADLDLANNRIKVMGKGNKEGYLVFGDKTSAFLGKYVNHARPAESLFGLTNDGLKTMLQRLERRTGIKCNTHSFRRGFATELRRKGLSELDIAELAEFGERFCDCPFNVSGQLSFH